MSEVVQMRPSILDPWRASSLELLSRLGHMDRAKRFKILDELRTVELLLDQHAVDWRAGRVQERMRMSTVIPAHDVEAASTACAVRALKRNLHTASIISERLAKGTIADIVDLESFERLTDLSSWGSAVVLPIHSGAIEAFVVVLSSLVPVTLVVAHGSGVPDGLSAEQANVWPEIDLEVIRAPGPDVLVRSVEAMRRNRFVVFPPEFTSKRGDAVVATQVAGVDVGVPSGYVSLAESMSLPLAPVHFVPLKDHTYQLKFDGPVSPSQMVGSVPAAIDQVFRLVGHVLETDPVDWEGWQVLDIMIADRSACPA